MTTDHVARVRDYLTCRASAIPDVGEIAIIKSGTPGEPAVLTVADVTQLLADLDRLHSWDGLMELLDEHWPEDIFPTVPDRDTRDPGPRIVALLRWLDRERTGVRVTRRRA